MRSSTGRKGHQLMQRVLGKSLKARLNRLLILVGILPIAIVFGFLLLSMRPNVISGAEERLLESSQLQALAVRNELDEARTNIELLAANPFVGSGDVDPELELEQLHQASDFFKVFEDITVLTPQGQARSSTTFSYLGSWKSSSAFTNALAGDTYVSRVLVAPDTMDLVINISAPVVKDGRVTAIVVGRMEMQEIWKLLEPLAIGDSGHALALDQNGNLIAHPDSERLLTKLSSDALIDDISAPHAAPAHDLDDAHDLGRAHSILLEFSDGSVETLGALTNIEGLGWQIGVVQAKSEAFAIVASTQRGLLLALSFVLLTALLGAAFLPRQLAKPLSALGSAMWKIGSGNLSQRISRAEIEEIQPLVDAFNSMAEDVETSSRDLTRMSSILEATTDFVGIADVDGRARYVNQAGLDMVGMPRDIDVSTTGIPDFHPP